MATPLSGWRFSRLGLVQVGIILEELNSTGEPGIVGEGRGVVVFQEPIHHIEWQHCKSTIRFSISTFPNTFPLDNSQPDNFPLDNHELRSQLDNGHPRQLQPGQLPSQTIFLFLSERHLSSHSILQQGVQLTVCLEKVGNFYSTVVCSVVDKLTLGNRNTVPFNLAENLTPDRTNSPL